MKNNWIQSNSEYRIREVSQQTEQLPVGIYKLEEDRYGLFLTQISDKFSLPEKVYDVQRSFIDRVKTSWVNTKGNMGILLNGTRGTGKTITAEMICNELQMPVIIIPVDYEGFTNLLAEMTQDTIIFIDEYDKIFSRESSTMLTIMDGVLKTDKRLMFLLTTNNSYLNENMYQRPSRIRYIKTFGNLSAEVVKEIVDDQLIHKQWREQTIEFIATLQIITIDLVMSTIQEVNIHNEDPANFRDVFNVTDSNNVSYNIFEVNPDTRAEKIIHSHAQINRRLPFDASDVDESIYFDNVYFGHVQEILDTDVIKVQVKGEDKDDFLSHILSERRKKGSLSVPSEEIVSKDVIIRVEPSYARHYSFNKNVL